METSFPRFADYELQEQDLRINGNCPRCQRLAVFKMYAHVETGELLPPFVGQCSRPECGHIYSAKAYLKIQRKNTTA